MPTKKRRINVTVDDAIYKLVERLAKRHEQSIAGLSLRLIEEALELREDAHFSRVADERLSKRQRRVPHAEAWD